MNLVHVNCGGVVEIDGDIYYCRECKVNLYEDEDVLTDEQYAELKKKERDDEQAIDEAIQEG